MNLIDNIYIGIILDKFDSIYPTKYFVKIPAISDRELLVQNSLNNYIAVKNNETTKFQGNYIPLPVGTKVNIKFQTNNINSGYIESIHYDNQAVPPGESADEYYLIMETASGAKIYFDNSKARFHINNNDTDFFMDQTSVIMQTSKNNVVTSSLELSTDSFIVKVGAKALTFSEAGFSINAGNRANTFINVTDKGIAMKGEEFLTIDTQKLDIRGESANIQSLGFLNLRGTVLNLTGSQKAALNSSVVHIEGWLSSYIKAGLSLNLESKVYFNTKCLINDEANLATKHVYSSVESTESLMSAETSTFKASAITTGSTDGIIINNLGVATAVAPSLATSLNTLGIGMQIGFMVFGTFMSFDNIASAVVGTVLTDSMIADAASPASPTTYSTIGIFNHTEAQNNNFLLKLREVSNMYKSDYSEGVIDYNKIPNTTFTARTIDNIDGKLSDSEIISSNLLQGNF